MSNEEIADSLFVDEDELDNDNVLMHKIDEILYGEHEKPYSTGDALLMLIRNQIAQHRSKARIDEIRRTRPYLTYPGMVYYGERMDELEGSGEGQL